MRNWWVELLDLVLPRSCAGCGRLDVEICDSCRARLWLPARRVDPPVAPGGRERAGGARPVGVWAGPDYAGAVARVILAWKDRGRPWLGRELSPVLAGAVRAGLDEAEDLGLVSRGSDVVALVGVPSSRRAIRRRGQDMVTALARGAAADLARHGWTVRTEPALRRRRHIRDQAGLAARARARNVAGAFAVRRRATWLVGQPVVLVDDVVTTGASLAEAARALREAGAQLVAICAVCATPARHGLSVRRRVD